MRSALSHLIAIRNESIEVLDSAPHAATDAIIVPSFINGNVGARLPGNQILVQAYQTDPETNLMLSFVKDPLLVAFKSILDVYYIYLHSVQNGLIYDQNGILFSQELFSNDDGCIKLQVVLLLLCIIVYVTFHCNPIGGHLSIYKTYACICTCYLWPYLFKTYLKLTACCSGCALRNITRHGLCDLVYGFPITAPMNVLHVDIYAVGIVINFERNWHYLVAACAMTSFSVAKPTIEKKMQKHLLRHL